MGKKILGYFFFVLGILCILSFIGNVISLIIGRKGETTTEFHELIMAILITVFLGFLFFKYGYKWTKKKPNTTDEIDHIGS
ncbi:MAG: hypothetical protein ACJA1H_000602 [Glaciecola sp.]|jgi:hypothetical protein